MAGSDQTPDPAAAFRQTAEQSVEQARKAFDDMMSLAQKTMSGLEANSTGATDHVRTITQETLAFAEASAEAAFRFLTELAQARSPDQVSSIQKLFVDEQMERLGRQTRTVGDEAIRAARDLTKPFER